MSKLQPGSRVRVYDNPNYRRLSHSEIGVLVSKDGKFYFSTGNGGRTYEGWQVQFAGDDPPVGRWVCQWDII